MICTNDTDLYNYLQAKGVHCIIYNKPIEGDILNIWFPETHVANVSCNAHTDKHIDEYKKEMDNIVNLLTSVSKILIITPVIKFNSQYMKNKAPEQYERLQKIEYNKQVIHERNIGTVTNPSRLQLRYKGIDKIDFDVVKSKNLIEPMYEWINKYGEQKQQQQHYINVINATKDKFERRKLRKIPRYTLYSQIYKKLKERDYV